MFNSEAQLENNGGVDSSDEHRALAMREYLDAVPHHVWTADSTGTRITWFNRRWHEYSGQTPEPAGALAAGLKAQGPFTADVRLRSKDGQFCWFQIRGEPVRQGERTRKRMEGLQRMTALLAKAVGVKQVVEAVLQNGLETVGAYAGGVFLIDEHGQQLVLQG